MRMACLSLRFVAAVLICVVSPIAVHAESEVGQRPQSHDMHSQLLHSQTWDSPWTVVTMAPDGSWGVASEAYIYQAIAGAVAHCRHSSGPATGCGAQFTVIRAGWTIALRCGRANIIVAEPTIAAAERAAAARETELRLAHSQIIPACLHVVTIGPSGHAVRTSPAIAQPDRATSSTADRR